MPTISVIVPVYNVEKYVAQTIESIINQTYKDLEIICVDDCGKDNSMQIVEDLAAKDDRIKIIKHEKNKGLGAARNTALQYAKGKYVCFLDSDDFFYPTAIEKAIAKLSETGCESVWMNIISYFEDEQQFREETYYKNLADYPSDYLKITPENINIYTHFTLNKVFSLDFIKKNNILFPEGLLYEDLPFHIEFYAKTGHVYIIPEKLCVYRHRKGSIMSNTKAGLAKREDICKIIKDVYNRLKKAGLFEEYRFSMLELFHDIIKPSIKQPEYRKKLIEITKLTLPEIEFPQAYEEQKSNGYYYFLTILKYDKSKKIRNFLKRMLLRTASLLSNLIPFSNTRKKIRRKIKSHFF